MTTNKDELEFIRGNEEHWENNDGLGTSFDSEARIRKLLLIVAEELIKMNEYFDRVEFDKNRKN